MTDNKTLIHNLYDAFGRGDLASILATMAPDVDWQCNGPASVPFCGTFRGPANVAKFFEALGTTQTGQKLTIEETFAEGDQVISIGRYSCVVTATNKPIDTKVAHVFAIRDGKIVRFLDFIDTAQVAEAYSTGVTSAEA